jgi:preprotein translocase subunit SecG
MDWGFIGTLLAIIFFITTIVLAVRLTRRKNQLGLTKHEE